MKNTENRSKKRGCETYSEPEATPRTIDAMPIRIEYLATHVAYSLQKAGDDFVFTFSDSVDVPWKDWNQRYLNAYEVRDRFERVSSPTEALDFLAENGPFLPHGLNPYRPETPPPDGFGTAFTWGEFQKWQELTTLVREHDALADAMKKRLEEVADPKKKKHTPIKTPSIPTVKEVEALKAISGVYDSTFFDGDQTREDWELRSWFRQPPRGAASIDLRPRIVTPQMLRQISSGLMIEYLYPRDALVSVLTIEAAVIIQAIAATLYVDRMAGVRVAKCPAPCGKLFEITRSWKKHCSENCQEADKKRRKRSRLKAEEQKDARRKRKKPR